MTLKSEHPPLTWARIEQLAQAGHDDFEPPLNAPRARELVASVRESYRATEARMWHKLHDKEQELDTANATLELVRAARDKLAMYQEHDGAINAVVRHLDAALASQPEAPKGPAAEAMAYEVHDFGTDKAIAVPVTQGQFDQVKRDLAAANARIAELTALNQDSCEKWQAANARADAAERERAAAEYLVAELATQLIVAEASAQEVERLTARVTELLADQAERGRYIDSLERMQCTPEERKVLEAMGAAQLGEEDADDVPGEPVELGDDCYLYTDDQRAVVKAELANRAAKAKRGAA